MVYFIPIIILLCLMYHYDYRGHNGGRRAWYLVMFVIFVCIAGLRYRIGVDSVRYAMHYNELPNLSQFANFDFSSTRYGVGYLFLSAVMRSISEDFTVMQFLLALIVNTALFTFFYSNTKNIFTCIFIYFLSQYTNYNFEILREACAVSIFIISWKFILQRQWIKYYMCAVVATLLHTSGAITLLVPLIFIPGVGRFFRLSKMTPVIVLFLFIISFMVSVYFFDALRLLEIASIDSYADSYQNTHYGEAKSLYPTRVIGFMVRIVLLPLLVIWYLKHKKISNPICKNTNYIDSLEKIIVLSIYIFSLSYSVAIVSRFNNYFAPFTILLVSDLPFYKILIFKRKIKLSFSLWSLFIFLYLSPNLMSLSKSVGDSNIPLLRRYYPYKSILFKEKDESRERLFNYEGIGWS